jgi:putative ABC transport system permease protein
MRNLRERPLRSALTIAGIGIGILALVVVGALAERLHTIVARSSAITSGLIFAEVQPRLAFDPDAQGRIARSLREIRAYAGVREVLPEVILPYRFALGGADRFGPPSLIYGFPAAARSLATGVLTIAQGREPAAGERGVAAIGADFAAAERAGAGSVISLYGNSYDVVGVFAKSFTVFDAGVVVSLADGQSLFDQAIPPTTSRLPRDPVSALMVVTEPRADAAAIAHRISLLPGLRARDPAEIASDVRSTTRIFDEIVFGAALVALLISALSIVNTMTIAVTERTREIGIRKAIGAGDGDILREFLGEAATIGLVGGVLGIAGGIAVTVAINARNAGSGSLELFAITPRLALGALAFSVALSIAAGLFPAIRAARLDPTVALRRLS